MFFSLEHLSGGILDILFFAKNTSGTLRGKAAVLTKGSCTHLALKYLYILSLTREGTCTLVAI